MTRYPPEYAAAHREIRRLKGAASAYPCVDCGGLAHHWSRDNDQPLDTRDPNHYAARCRSCHYRHDNAWQHAANQSQREKRTGSDEYAAFMVRLMKSYGRKAHAGDLDTTSLEQLAEIQAVLDEQTAEVVRALRSEAGGSHSWTEIGKALGITRGAALRRYGSADSDVRKAGGQPAHLR